MIKEELYRGKAKTLYKTDTEACLLVDFRNDTSAFDGEKVVQLQRKGLVNNQFNAYIMEILSSAGIPTHFIKLASGHESLVKHLNMFPIECVIRNRAAGSLCRRLGVEKGMVFSPPIFEFFLKNDALHDPMINESHIATFQWANDREIAEMKRLTLAINEVLIPLFEQAGMLLVDYKVEFGIQDGVVILGDEFTPDGCRIWDKQTNESLDKDRFRQDLGGVVESYEIAAHRLGIPIVG